MPAAPTVQAWVAGVCRNDGRARRAGEQKTERHKGVADVQDQHQPVAQRAIAGPSGQPHDMQARPRWRAPRRSPLPSGCAIHSARVAALKPITATSKRANGAGSRPGFSRASQLRVKLGNDAAADHHEEQHHGGDAYADAIFCAAADMRLEMKRDIAGEQQRDQADDPQVSPILASDNLARGRRRRPKPGKRRPRSRPAASRSRRKT